MESETGGTRVNDILIFNQSSQFQYVGVKKFEAGGC